MVCCIDSYISESNKLECVRLLLQYNAQVNDKDKYEATALMLAAGNGYTRIVDEFLQICNLDINLQDNDGSSVSNIKTKIFIQSLTLVKSKLCKSTILNNYI